MRGAAHDAQGSKHDIRKIAEHRSIEIEQTVTEMPVPRDELLHKVWGYDRNLNLETRTVDIHIAKLRRKIEPTPAEPRYLLTVRGAGYRLQSH